MHLSMRQLRQNEYMVFSLTKKQKTKTVKDLIPLRILAYFHGFMTAAEDGI